MEEAKTRRNYNGPATAEDLARMEKGAKLSNLLHLEIESFYQFAKILLDNVATYYGCLFGPRRRVSYVSHNELTKSWPELVEAAKLQGDTDRMLAAMKELQEKISDFRDKQITHDHNPRRIRGTIFDARNGPRMMYSTVMPTAKELAEMENAQENLSSGNPRELLQAIDDYIEAALSVTEQNMGASSLKPSES